MLRWLRGLREACGYLALTILATWPLARHFASAAPGTNEWNGRVLFVETPVNLWNLWWFRHALVTLGQSPFDGSYTFYPYGANLWFHTLSPLPALVGLVLQPLAGLVITQNLLVLAAFVIAGVAAAAAGRALGLSNSGAFLAGAIFAFCPAVISHLYVGHFELLWTCWIPIALLCFLRVIERPGVAAALWLGGCLAAAAYSSTYYAVFGVEVIAVAAVVRWRSVWRGRVLAMLALAAVVTLAATAPLISHFVRADAPVASREEVQRDFRLHSVEIGSFVAPSFAHPVLGPLLRPLHEKFNRGDARPQETTGSLGLTTIVLIGVLWLTESRSRSRQEVVISQRVLGGSRIAVAMAATFLVLALGAELKWLGRPTGVPLPAALLAETPVLKLARAPGRYVIPAMLGVAVLAAAGWERLGRRGRTAAAVLLAFEFLPAPIPLFSTAVPEVATRLARETEPFAVLDVPLGLRDGLHLEGHPDGRDLLAQTIHGHPIVAGMVSRLPAERWTALRSAPLIGALLEKPGQRRLDPALPTAARAFFTQWRIRAIVIHPNALEEDRALIDRTLPIARRETFADGTELWWVW